MSADANVAVAAAESSDLSSVGDEETAYNTSPSQTAQSRKAKSKGPVSKAKPVAKSKAKATASKSTPNARGKGKKKAQASPVQFDTRKTSADSSTTITDLPPEIRNDIWTMLLVQPKAIAVSPTRPFVKEPALLAVNRQIRSETMSIWYAENSFLIDGSSPAVKFLRSRDDQQLRSLRSVHISSEKSKQMKEAPRAWSEHLQKKVETIMREFEERGFRRFALQFQFLDYGELVWVNGDQLQSLTISGLPDIGKKIKSGPRKGEYVDGRAD